MTKEKQEIPSYYDTFSRRYDKDRTNPSFTYFNKAKIDLLKPYITGKNILEVGCGTGIILARTSTYARSATGLDISDGMLAYARGKGLSVVKASADHIPFKNGTFDTVYSFMTLPHVPNIREAVHEAIRVTKKGGWCILEFYNPYSWRAAIHSTPVYRRADTMNDIISYFPHKIHHHEGLRIVTPASLIHAIPVVSSVVQLAEHAAGRTPLARLAFYRIIFYQV